MEGGWSTPPPQPTFTFFEATRPPSRLRTGRGVRVGHLRTLHKDQHQEFWEDKGKWKPLSVWVSKGYDAAMLQANSTAKDRRPDPVFGEVYRVRCMEDGIRHHQGYTNKVTLQGTAAVTRAQAALAIADGDPNAHDSSSSDSADSSDSSDSSDKHKKHKKHKKDKKGKKDKKSKKEKKHKKDSNDKSRKRGLDKVQPKSNMSASPPHHSDIVASSPKRPGRYN